MILKEQEYYLDIKNQKGGEDALGISSRPPI